MQPIVRTLVTTVVTTIMTSVAWGGGALAQVSAKAPAPTSLTTSAVASAGQYARYTPGECAQDPRQERQFSRDRMRDTLPLGPGGGSLDKSTIAAVRQCVARYALATVPERDLLGLGTAYLAASQDVDAAAAFKRLVSEMASRSLTERAWMLYRVVRAYVEATPSRIDRARATAAQLDSLGVPAAAERLLAHLAIVTRAQIMDTLPLLETHVTAAIAASQQLSAGDSAKMYASATATAYLARADLSVRHDSLEAARTTLREITTITERVRPQAMIEVELKAPWYLLLGERAPRIQATTWITAKPVGDSAPVVPAPGRPSLIVFVSSHCNYRGADSCYPNYAIVRRLMAKYPTVPATFVTRTEGSYRGRLVQPDSEALLVGQYFTRVLNFQAPVAIWQTVFDRRADAYMMARRSPNDSAYQTAQLNRAADGAPVIIVVDAKGVIRRVAPLIQQSERTLDNLIGALLRPVSGAPSGSTCTTRMKHVPNVRAHILKSRGIQS